MTLSISKPFTDDEMMMMDLMEPGTYKFKIIESTPRVSQKGAPMIAIKLSVIHNDREYIIDDYLLTNSKQMLFKLKHCLDSIGSMDLWETCSFNAIDFLNKTGYALIGLSKGAQKPDGSFYPDKNNVMDYIKQEQHDKLASNKPFVDDDLPF